MRAARRDATLAGFHTSSPIMRKTPLSESADPSNAKEFTPKADKARCKAWRS